MRLVTLGDSITAATNGCGDGWPTFLTMPLDYFYNAGIGGTTTTQAIARLDADVLAHTPTDVVVMLGTNDLYGGHDTTPEQMAWVVANIGTILDSITAAGAKAWLLTIPPAEGGWDDGTAVQTYNAAMATTAAAHDATLIDVWSWLATGSDWVDESYVCDGIHPTAAGAAVIASRVQAALYPVAGNPTMKRHNMAAFL